MKINCNIFWLILLTPFVSAIDVPGTVEWFDTGISINSGDEIQISASGFVKIAGSDPSGYSPEGVVETTEADVAKLLCPTTNKEYSLVGKIGTGGCFDVGSSRIIVAQNSGNLYLSSNDRVGLFGDNSGSWNVDVVVNGAGIGNSSGVTSGSGGGGSGSVSSNTENVNQPVQQVVEQTSSQESYSSTSNCAPEFVGSSYCKGNSVYRAYTLDTCDVSEKVVNACSNSEKCIDGQCVKVCKSVNECTPGSNKCESNGYQICMMSDDGCFKWSAKTNCKDDEICLDGKCNPKQNEMVQITAPSIQLKRTNEGIVGVKSAEIIFDIVNVDVANSLEGFLLCKTPDDATVSSTMGAASGLGAQYTSPIFIIDMGPSQKSITVTLDSDTAGEKRSECIIKYAFFKEHVADSGTIRKYIKNDGTFTTDRQDSLFKELRLDKSVLFKNVETKEKSTGNVISRLFAWLSRLFGGE